MREAKGHAIGPYGYDRAPEALKVTCVFRKNRKLEQLRTLFERQAKILNMRRTRRRSLQTSFEPIFRMNQVNKRLQSGAWIKDHVPSW
jgi:hypothetical protein